jgi:hypothetical protein
MQRYNFAVARARIAARGGLQHGVYSSDNIGGAQQVKQREKVRQEDAVLVPG